MKLKLVHAETANHSAEYEYKPFERFTDAELDDARFWRAQYCEPDARYTTRRDRCPHSPPCPSERVCVEEIAWFLRHRTELMTLPEWKKPELSSGS